VYIHLTTYYFYLLISLIGIIFTIPVFKNFTNDRIVVIVMSSFYSAEL